MVKHFDVNGKQYSPAPPGDSLCRTCKKNKEDCTWPGRMVVLCMGYEKYDPGQAEIQGPRSAEEIYKEAQNRRNGDSILKDSVR